MFAMPGGRGRLVGSVVIRVRVERRVLAILTAACVAGLGAAPVQASPPVFGKYQPLLVSPPGDAGSQRIHTADVNGDGKDDLVATRLLDPDNNGVLVFLSTTAASAATPTFAGPTPSTRVISQS